MTDHQGLPAGSAVRYTRAMSPSASSIRITGVVLAGLAAAVLALCLTPPAFAASFFHPPRDLGTTEGAMFGDGNRWVVSTFQRMTDYAGAKLAITDFRRGKQRVIDTEPGCYLGDMARRGPALLVGCHTGPALLYPRSGRIVHFGTPDDLQIQIGRHWTSGSPPCSAAVCDQVAYINWRSGARFTAPYQQGYDLDDPDLRARPAGEYSSGFERLGGFQLTHPEGPPRELVLLRGRRRVLLDNGYAGGGTTFETLTTRAVTWTTNHSAEAYLIGSRRRLSWPIKFQTLASYPVAQVHGGIVFAESEQRDAWPNSLRIRARRFR